MRRDAAGGNALPELASLSSSELQSFQSQTKSRYETLKQRGADMNLTRGKPSDAQIDLSNELLALPGAGDYRAADGLDCRNYYGDARGLLECRQIFAPMLGAPPDQVAIDGVSSLALMHDAIVFALLTGVPDGRGPWSADGPIAFLCPSPGYDRHFALCEGYGIKLIPVAMTGAGPDMDEVERLVADPAVKGMWCVPKYSNPSGDVYSDETIERLARMTTGAPDFRIFWDNAYAVHHLTSARIEIANVLDACARHGHANRVFVFGSTSKITFGGAGLGMFASSPENMTWWIDRKSRATIGPDKLNQLRHVRLLGSYDRLLEHMERHRQILAPKFAKVQTVFGDLLGGTGVATWTDPQGGYFISLDVMDGTAKRTVDLAKQAGIAVTPAGRTFPYSKDPRDRNIRIAPSYPELEEVELAAEGVALSALLAASEKLLEARRVVA
jgi:DNA-binding transcriptional MocR family regulator